MQEALKAKRFEADNVGDIVRAPRPLLTLPPTAPPYGSAVEATVRPRLPADFPAPRPVALASRGPARSEAGLPRTAPPRGWHVTVFVRGGGQVLRQKMIRGMWIEPSVAYRRKQVPPAPPPRQPPAGRAIFSAAPRGRREASGRGLQMAPANIWWRRACAVTATFRGGPAAA
jgi:hypothetical protein